MTKHLLLPLLLGAIAFLGGVSSLAFAQSAEGNSPPTVDPIHANLFPPTTTYAVEATDPDGGPLQYHWERDIACGVFIGSGPSASWSHPEGVAPLGCPHEDGTSHDGVVSVHVTDGTHYVLCSYTGSESGDGAQCITNAPEYSPGVMDRWMGYIYEICYWLWLPLLIGMLWLGRWLYQNGLFVGRKEEDTDPCAELRRKEAEARARYNAAREGFDEIDRLKRDADAKDRAAKDAEAKAERARSAAGGKWSAQGSTDWEGEHTEISREGWQNKEAGAKADAATAEARAAREAAGKANGDFNAKGGSSGWSRAKGDAEKAKSEWEAADAALRVCIGGIGAPKPEPKSEPPPGGTSTGGGTGGSALGGTPGPSAGPGPTTTPPPTKKPEPVHVCVNGERRNERTESIQVSILDLPSVRLMQDRIYSDAGNEAMKFVDYLQTIKDLFMLGKSMKGGAEAYLEGSIEGASDAVNFPDFLTWYDEGIDELTKSMHKLYEIMQDKQRLGDYWLEYRIKKLTLTCTRYDVCANNRWVRKCALTIADNGMETHRTEPESVLDIRELQPAIRKLFTKLRNRYKGDQTRAGEFTRKCAS